MEESDDWPDAEFGFGEVGGELAEVLEAEGGREGGCGRGVEGVVAGG